MAYSMLRWRLDALLCILLAMVRSTSALAMAYCSTQNTGGSMAYSSIFNSDGKCHDQCISNFAFAILQDDNCWCSNDIPELQVSTSECNVSCPGYPSDTCGNSALGLYGYIQLTLAPSGTSGGGAAQTSISSAGGTSSSSQPSSQSSSESTATQNVLPLNSFSSSSQSQETPKSDTTATTPITSVQVITVSGNMVTQTVTSTPTTGAGALLGGTAKKSSGMSGGLIAAAVIASIFGVVIIGAIIFFLLRRRRKNNTEDEKFGGLNDDPTAPSNINRNTSTNSKAGLLDRGFPPMITTRVSSHTGQDMSSSSGAISPVTPNSDRRHSKPLMYDQRLNPNALMVIDNGSHTSLNTLDDHRDYGRMLKVVNPDNTPRPSIS